jgi:hypothetical protein
VSFADDERIKAYFVRFVNNLIGYFKYFGKPPNLTLSRLFGGFSPPAWGSVPG